MAEEHAEQEPEEAAAGEPVELLDVVNEALAAVDAEPGGGEIGDAAETVATRMPLARQPQPKTAPRKVPLNADDIADLKRVGTRTIKELAKLEQERAITTAEAEEATARIEEVMQLAKKGRGDRAVLARNLNRMRALPEWNRKRAAVGRSTKGKKLLSDFKVESPVVRVGEHESARISFVVKGTPKSVGAFILSDPDRDGTSYRFFNMDAMPGYHQAIWDGTFEGSRNRAPRPGVYRIEISVLAEDGKSERASRSASRTQATRPCSRGSVAGWRSRRSHSTAARSSSPKRAATRSRCWPRRA
jgi:hypothetical protein